MITLVVVTDGRDECLIETIQSARERLDGPITRRILYDDTGDAEHRAALADLFPDFVIAHHPNGRQGFGGAIRFLWRELTARDQNPFVFWLEDDFTFNRHVDLWNMMGVLDAHPELAQVALRRQPWSDEEIAAGGVVELHPDDYTQIDEPPFSWLVHQRFFTTNPSLFPRSLCSLGWPEDPHSEGHFGIQLREAGRTMAFWGRRHDGAWVTHIGKQRIGHSY